VGRSKAWFVARFPRVAMLPISLYRARQGKMLPLKQVLRSLINLGEGFFSKILCAARKSEGESSAPIPRKAEICSRALTRNLYNTF
ncbi:MAG: hypothetical protein IJG58_01730, partial [Oscillospiraceae bacterium]|nr:hypothetical protein [Oscillospiraceae bacterium]